MKRRVSSAAKGPPKRARVLVGPVTTIRSALTVAGDIRSDVQFQNDVNALLATVGKLTALGPKAAPVQPDDFEVTFSEAPEPVAATPPPIPAVQPSPLRRIRASSRG